MAALPPTTASDDYSAAATVTTFPLPLPLLRHPHPSSSTPLLAFPTPHSFFSAITSARSHLLSQCESGARIGCSLRASARCQPPWWHFLLGGGSRGFAERAECEEKESRECFEAARGECVRVVRDKCVKGFGGAWVRVRGGEVYRGTDLLGDDF